MTTSTISLRCIYALLLCIPLCNTAEVIGKYYFESGDSAANSITYDPHNNTRAWIAGTTNGTFNGFPSPYGRSDAYYMEISLIDLSVNWFYFLGSPLDDAIMDTVLRYDNGIPILYLAGKTEGNLFNVTHTAGSSMDAFIVAININNPTEPLFVSIDGGLGAQNTSSLAVDADGNSYVVGDTIGAFDSQPSFGSFDGFILKYNSTGGKVWTRIFGNTSSDSFRGVAVNPTNASQGVFIIGITGGNFAGNPGNGGADMLLALISPDGDLVWSRLIGGGGDDSGWSVTLDKTGSYMFAAACIGLEFVTISMDPETGDQLWTQSVGSNSFIDVAFAISISNSQDYVCTGGDIKNSAQCLVSCYDFQGNFVYNSTYASEDGLNHVADLKGDLWNGSLYAVGISTGNFYGNTPTAFNNAYAVKLTIGKNHNSDNSKDKTIPIVAATTAIVVLVVLGGIAGGFFTVWYLRRKHRRQMAAEFALESASPSKVHRNKGLSHEHSKYIIDYSEVKIGAELGSGNFGIVHIGSWRSQMVAIKEIKQDFGEDSKELQDFLNEAIVMMSMKPHKNITTLYAVCLSPLLIVTEYVENGSLDRFLATTPVSFEQILQILKDVAAGMHHLAAEGVIHKDLSARNVLISKDGTAKIADFGLARGHEENIGAEKEKGPTRWMSPESLSKREFSEKSDVWSFAATTVEILTGRVPYQGTAAAVVVKQVTADKLKPELPVSVQLQEGLVQVPQQLIELIRSCTKFEPLKRPRFVEITQILSEISPESHPLIGGSQLVSDSSSSSLVQLPQSTGSEYNNLQARRTQEDMYNTQAEYEHHL